MKIVLVEAINDFLGRVISTFKFFDEVSWKWQEMLSHTIIFKLS
jgi:hypothetical protein